MLIILCMRSPFPLSVFGVMWWLPGHQPASIEKQDLLIILLRIGIVYLLVIDPAIYRAFQTCGNNPGKPMCIVNMEVILTFILSVIFLNAKVESKVITGMVLMLTGGYLIAYR